MDQDQRQRNDSRRPGLVTLQFTPLELGALDQALMLAQSALASLGASISQQLRPIAQEPAPPSKPVKGAKSK